MEMILTGCSEFNEGFGKDIVEGQLSVIPDEWKGDIWKSSLSFNGVAAFHKPGMCYSVDLVVAVPNKWLGSICITFYMFAEI